jgi:hypothetical protein
MTRETFRIVKKTIECIVYYKETDLPFLGPFRDEVALAGTRRENAAARHPLHRWPQDSDDREQCPTGRNRCEFLPNQIIAGCQTPDAGCARAVAAHRARATGDVQGALELRCQSARGRQTVTESMRKNPVLSGPEVPFFGGRESFRRGTQRCCRFTSSSTTIQRIAGTPELAASTGGIPIEPVSREASCCGRRKQARPYLSSFQAACV